MESKTDYGLKETVKKLLTDNGAVAGVNSDFFGLSGSYSAAFGPIVRDGEVISAGTSINKGEGQYAAFFMDENGNPFFDYFTIERIFAFLLKLEMIERWISLDKERGNQLFRSIIESLKNEVQIPAEFR